MAKHSNIVGGSTASRILNCPGSIALIASMPEQVDRPSIYATEGSALHHVLADLITTGHEPDTYLNEVISVPGEDDIEITQELLHDCVTPAIEHFDDTILINLSPDGSVLVEQQVEFPRVGGAFGTCDLIAFDPEAKCVYIHDWKFGAGIPVKAIYPDPDDPDYEILNPQLLFYAAGARHTFPQFFPPGVEIRLSIFQPRAQNPIDRATLAIAHHDDLDRFERGIVDAIATGTKPDAPKKLGEWCRFAPCRTICPLQLAPMLDLGELLPPEAVSKLQTPEILSNVLQLAELLEPVIAEARRQAHEILEGGGQIPGYKLVPKRANRSWMGDEASTLRALRRLKILKAKALTYSLKSPAQIEKLMPRGTKLPEALVAKISSGTTLARDDDPRPSAQSLTDTMREIVIEVPALTDDWASA
jgi:Protein of unknown function (DUF2800)